MFPSSSLLGCSLLLAGLASFPARAAQSSTAPPLPLLAQAAKGTALAKELQGKPVVVDVYASWCPACRNIAPTLSKLRQSYANRVHFVVLDVSDKAKTEASQATAKRLGLASFFATNRTQTGLVAIIEPATGKILSQQRNNADVGTYTAVLNKALAQ
ncbi:MAG: TlpA family protein disulfide reductase [Cyanobium sp.]